MNPNHASAASVPRVSYAQNQEDILLDRLFRGQTATYVEVGAHHPVQDSNTYFFYQRGWSGVTCEPLPHLHGLLRAHRPNDLHLAVAFSDHDGDLPFYQVPQCDGLSTLSEAVAERHRRQGLQVVQTQVPVRTLARLIAQYRLEVPELLVIDVEGHEREVLAGVPWASWRPKVLVVEATLPLSGEPSHAAWEPLLLEQGYLLDNFTHAETVFLREHIEHLERRLRQLEAQASPRPEAATTALR